MASVSGVGIVVILVGAFASAAFGLGLKFARTWKWEHIWLLYSFFGMLLIPCLLGILTVESLWGVLASANVRDLLLVFLFGLGWGLGAVLYGLALKMIGLALSYAIVMGLTAAIGTLAPFVLLHTRDVLTFKGLVIATSVLLLVLGVALSAWAGRLREKARTSLENSSQNTEPVLGQSPPSSPFSLGLFIAVLAGIFSPMLNLSFAYGAPLAEVAVSYGTQSAMATNVIWIVALSAGFLVNAGYCIFLISKNRSWKTLSDQPFHYGVGLAMGALWVFGIICYGMGGSMLGELRAVIGWPLTCAMSILGANFWGALSGEWTGVGRKPIAVMCVSVSVLTAAMFIIGWAHTLS